MNRLEAEINVRGMSVFARVSLSALAGAQLATEHCMNLPKQPNRLNKAHG